MLAAVLDHLWQSTLVALAVGLLILIHRKASAAVRYGLWFATSIKFLLPFAALAALGRRLAAAGLSPAPAPSAAVLIQRAARPLSQFPFAHDAALRGPLHPSALARLPLAQVHASAAFAAPRLDPAAALVAVWALGSAGVLVVWAARWAHVRRIARSATRLDWPTPMPVLASPALMEPGLIGLVRPVLVVPQTLPERLSRPEIEAVLAHEACHLRRRDNLTAALHMLVEALFWFHPLVWWIGGRLIAERERACDEAVVEAGHDRTAYARSLVESARFYLQSPLICVAGAAGSGLKTRVVAIMTAPPSSPLSPLGKAVLAGAGACALALPVAVGLLGSPEARKTLAQAAILAARPAPAPAPAAAAVDDAAGPAPRALSGAEAGRAPRAVEVANREAAPAGDGPGPAVDPAAAPAAVRSIEVAALAPAAVAPPPVAAPVTAVPPVTVRAPLNGMQIRQQSFRFVRAYAAAPNPELDQIARWRDPVCVQVVGLADGQDAQVKARIETVAREVGLPAARAGCRANVEIVFTPEPQRLMADVAQRREELLGYYHRHDRTRLAAVTRPIQAWYATATLSSWGGAVGRDAQPLAEVVDDPDNRQPSSCGISHIFSHCEQSVFKNVLVVADSKALDGRDLGLLADYLVMLTLSQPRSLDRCNSLPSMVDLFAAPACPGRDAPDGLTAADAAYLTALYQADPDATKWAEQGDIAGRMATILISATAAAGGKTAPG